MTFAAGCVCGAIFMAGYTAFSMYCKTLLMKWEAEDEARKRRNA